MPPWFNRSSEKPQRYEETTETQRIQGTKPLRTIAKLISLFYGTRMLLASLGMALYCYLDPNAFGDVGKETGIDFRLFLLTAGLIPQAGLGSLMIWLGMPSRSRMRTWRIARTTIKQIIEN